MKGKRRTCCIFCYKLCSGTSADNSKIQENFFRLLRRYLRQEKITSELETVLESNKSDTQPQLSSCPTCLPIMNSFCDYYSEMEKLELIVKWKLWTLTDIIRSDEAKANYNERIRVGESFECQVKESESPDGFYGDANKLVETVKALTNELAKKCIQKVNSGYPKILLGRGSIPNDASPHILEFHVPEEPNEDFHLIQPKNEIEVDDDNEEATSVEDISELSCPECGRMCHSLAGLQLHRLHKHPTVLTKEVIRCLASDCKKQFINKKSLIIHLKRCHPEQPKLLLEAVAMSTATFEKGKAVAFREKVKRRRKMLLKEQGKHRCPDCGEDFLTFSWLQRHRVYEHPYGVGCIVPGCGKRFIREKNMKLHVKLRHKNQRHIDTSKECDAKNGIPEMDYDHFGNDNNDDFEEDEEKETIPDISSSSTDETNANGSFNLNHASIANNTSSNLLPTTTTTKKINPELQRYGMLTQPKSTSTGDMIHCPSSECTRQFRNVKNVKFHMRHCHPDQLKLIEESTPMSSTSTATSSPNLQHQHRKEIALKMKMQRRKKMLLKDEGKLQKLHRCLDCGEDFLTFSWLQRHRVYEHPYGVSCIVPGCGKRFIREKNMKLHVKLRHKNQRHLVDQNVNETVLEQVRGDAETETKMEASMDNIINEMKWDDNIGNDCLEDNICGEEKDKISTTPFPECGSNSSVVGQSKSITPTQERKSRKSPRLLQRTKKKISSGTTQQITKKRTKTAIRSVRRKKKGRKRLPCFEFMKTEHKCRVNGCNFIFYNEEDLHNHSKLHWSFQCFTCPFKESYAPRLLFHEMKHIQEKGSNDNNNYHCPRENCSYSSKIKTDLNCHFLQAHMNLLPSTHTCPVCGKKLDCSKRTTPLYLHFKVCHVDVSSTSTDLKRCDVPGCKAYFRTVMQLKSHKLRMHLYRTHPCSEKDCDLRFPTLNALQRHRVAVHSIGVNCIAPGCKKKFVRYGGNSMGMTRHIRLHHPQLVQSYKSFLRKPRSTTSETFPCKITDCSETFYSEEDLNVHSSLHGNFPCTYCDETFTYAGDLALHEINHSDILAPEKRFILKKIKRKSIFCPRCNFRTVYQVKYIQHHLELHQNLRFVHRNMCNICKYVVEYRPTLKFHRMKYHDLTGLDPSEVYHCDIDKDCNAYFRTRFQLENHRNFAHYIAFKEVQCPEPGCGVMIKEGQKNLLLHMQKMHKNLYPVPCTFEHEGEGCEKRFKTEELMQKHVKLCHDIEKEICPECGKEIKGLVALNLHLKAKHPSLNCPQCGKKFAHQGSLKKHILGVHVGPDGWKYCCEVCGKKNLTREKFEKHRRTHTDEKPYACDYCENRYTNRCNFKNHLKNKHGVLLEKPKRKK